MGIYRKRGKYFIDFYADGKRVRECVGDVPRRKAEDALKVRKAEVVQGKYQLRRKAPVTAFKFFAADFLEYSKAHKSSRTSESDETRLAHLIPFFGRYRLDQITRFIVEKYVHDRRSAVSRRSKPPASATINRELAVLRNMFNKAIQWGKAEQNPVSGMRFLKESPFSPRILTDEEELRLLLASPPHVRVAILLATNAGLRLGEVLALRWKDIDFTNDVLTVERGKGGKRREVEINARLKSALVEYRKLRGTWEYLFYSERTGKPILSPKRAFGNALERSGIGHCRFHDLRHTFGTRLVCDGNDIVTVKELLGHASIQMTLRYSHPGARERRRAVDLLADRHHMDTTRDNVVVLESAKSLQKESIKGG